MELPSRSGSCATALAAVVLAGVIATPASAGVNVAVPCSGADGGPPGLRSAFDAANADGSGTISLAAGCTYTFTDGPYDNGWGADALPVVTGAIALSGNGATLTRDPSSADFRLLEVADVPGSGLDIADLTVTNGSVDPTLAIPIGGAILDHSDNGHGPLKVTRSRFTDNTATDGGAIGSAHGNVEIESSVITSNHARGINNVGGAIANFGGAVIVRSTRIENNTASARGGGIFSPAGTMTVVDSTISDNAVTSHGQGGGIFAGGGASDLTVRGSTISGNQADFEGGGIDNSGNIAVERSTIAGNSAGVPDESDVLGGGISNHGTGTLTSVTVAGNAAVGDGPLGGGIANAGDLTVTSSIVAGNAAGNCAGTVDDGGYDLEDGSSCAFATHAVDADPLLQPLAGNGGPTQTMALAPGSPAVGQVPGADPGCGGTTDQRGVPRPQGDGCDIGALEVVATATSLNAPGTATSSEPVTLAATVMPQVAVPGTPQGTVTFFDGSTPIGAAPLSGGAPDSATLTLTLSTGTHQLSASIPQSSLFLASASAPVAVRVAPPSSPTGGPEPSLPPFVGVTLPKLALRSHTIFIDEATGRGAAAIRCPAPSNHNCRVRGALVSRRAARRATAAARSRLGAIRGLVRGGRTGRVRVKLDHPALLRLRRARRLAVGLTLRGGRYAAASTGRATLRIRPRRRR
jgi:hypothetical protein